MQSQKSLSVKREARRVNVRVRSCEKYRQPFISFKDRRGQLATKCRQPQENRKSNKKDSPL